MSDNINEKLYWAAEDENYEEAAACIARGADPAWTNNDGWTALHAAASSGSVQVAGLLLDHGWDKDARTTYKGWRPLHWAAGAGRVEVIRLLAERGAEINCQDDVQDTPLHEAARYDQTAAVKLLISLGADTTIKNNEGKTADDVASVATKSLFKKMTQDKDQLLLRAVEAEDWLKAEILVGRGCSTMVDVMTDLLVRGADINSQDYYKDTPLHRAVRRGDGAAVKMLLSCGANRRIKNKEDKIPEEVSANEDIRSLFMEDREDLLIAKAVRAIKEKNWSGVDEVTRGKILREAAALGLSEILKRVIAEGAPVEAKDDKGNSALQLAIKNCHKDIVKILLSNGATIYSRNNEGKTPLDAAKKDEEILKILFEELLGFTLKNNRIFKEEKFQNFIGYGDNMFHLRKLFRRSGSKSDERKCFIEYIVDQGNAMIEQQEQLGKPSKLYSLIPPLSGHIFYADSRN